MPTEVNAEREPKQREVHQQIEVLQSTIERLDNQVERLRSHLDPVLGPELPAESGPDVAEASDPARISGQIRIARDRLDQITESVIRTIDRLEV